MKISIIIISYAKTEALKAITEQALSTLRESENRHKFEVIVVESMDGVRYQKADKVIKPIGSLNYNAYCNQGAEHATGRLIGFFNNDVVFRKGWAEAIVDAFNENPDLGSASPWCEQSHPDLGAEKGTGLHYGYQVRRHFAGWAFLLKRSTWKTIGSLPIDTSFWFADNQVCDNLKANKIPHALVTTSEVMHLESKTLKTVSEARAHQLTHGQKKAYNETKKEK